MTLPRLAAFLLVAVVALTAVGCGGDTAESEPATSATASPEQASETPLETLRVRYPETLAFSAPFALFDAHGALAGHVVTVDKATWATPDALRTMLVSGESDVTAVPTYVAANLWNHGLDVRLAAVTVWGLLYVLGPDGAPTDWDALRGQTVMVPYPNDMPDLVFRYLAEANGLVPGKDFEIEYYAQPPEVAARLASGKGHWAVLPEHVATLTLAKTAAQGKKLARVLDLQAEWAEATGLSPRIPQAGIVVPGTLADQQPEVVGAVLDELRESVAEVNSASPGVVATLAKSSGVPAPLVTRVIPRLNLDVVPAADARDELERFYDELATLSPDIIGGKLPDKGFYLADPTAQ